MAEDRQVRDRLERLNLILRTIRNVDQVILRETDRDRLIKGVCNSLVATRGYYNAWIVLLDEARGFITAAEAGLGDAFVTLVEKLKREGLSRCGRQALAQPEAVVVSDPASTCTDCPISSAYRGRGGIAARLYYRWKLYGLLCASVPASLVEEQEERSLFEEIAQDVTFALHKIGLEEAEKRAQENLRAYAEQAILAQEEERKRIARELHDETAQALASLGMDIGTLARKRKKTPGDTSKSLEALQKKTEAILRGVRALSKALRPPMLEEFGMLSALGEMLNELTGQQEISGRFDIQGTPRRLAPDVEMTLYRVAQEALANIRKHAQATKCALVMNYSPGKVVLEISDNGRGFELPERADDLVYSGKLGLAGMQERAKLIGGRLTIESHPGKGTAVMLELPLKNMVAQT